MGLETAALIVAGVATVGKTAFEVKGAMSSEEALDIQAKQNELQTTQKTLQNYSVMEKVLEAQMAHMTTTGLAFSSPSFNAIQRETLNIGSRRQKNINIEDELARENLKIEKSNVRSKLFAQLFGTASQVALGAAKYQGNTARIPQAE